MLIIREAQRVVLSYALFEQWLEAHLREHFRRRSAAFTAPQLRQFIRTGVEKAKCYGFIEESDLCRYIDISMVCGVDFDVDPKLPWANAILKDPAFTSPSVRLEMLFGAACEHLRRVEHPEEFSSPEDDEPPPEEDEPPPEDDEENEAQDDLSEVDDEDAKDAAFEPSSMDWEGENV